MKGVDAEQLRGYIRDAVELQITYLDLKDARTTRTIKPLALTYHIEVVLLAAWCGLRQDFRSFRIDRISALVPSGVLFLDEADALRKAWTETLEHEDWVLYNASKPLE